MRIAIYHNLPSGGGKRALREMMQRLSARHSIDTYSLSTAEHKFCDIRPFAEEYKVFGFKPLPLSRRPFGRINQGIRTLDLLRLRSLQEEIADEIDRAGYDVVFIHNCQFGQSPSLLQFLKTLSVYYCQEPPRMLYEPEAERPYNTISKVQRLGNRLDPFPRMYRRTLGGIDRKNVRSASLVLVNSHYSRETLYRTYGIFAKVSHLGVDFETFRPLKIAKKNQVVSVGALSSRKGFDFLIRSIALIDAGIRPSLALVCNLVDAREHTYLLQLAHNLGVKVKIHARISDEELVELYNQSLITMYAPIMEPFGFVPLESMACTTPVLGVCEAGIRETVLHGQTGLLVERDLHAFASAATELISSKSLRSRMGRVGREYVENSWSWKRSVDELQNIIHNLVSSNTEV